MLGRREMKQVTRPDQRGIMALVEAGFGVGCLGFVQPQTAHRCVNRRLRRWERAIATSPRRSAAFRARRGDRGSGFAGNCARGDQDGQLWRGVNPTRSSTARGAARSPQSCTANSPSPCHSAAERSNPAIRGAASLGAWGSNHADCTRSTPALRSLFRSTRAARRFPSNTGKQQ